MIASGADALQVERVDDIPLLLFFIYQMHIPRILDEHYPQHGNWLGELSFGDVAGLWLAYILSTGDHRLCHLQAWVTTHRQMLESSLCREIRPLDLHDDRLAAMLDQLAGSELFHQCESALNRSLLRIYDLPNQQVRLDATTSKTYAGASAEGLLQYGYSSDKRPDLAQIKCGLASLDPLGLPLATLVVSGAQADDGLYLPLVREVRASLGGGGGQTYIGDSKMDALGTRGYIVAGGDFYLSPLSRKQVSAEELGELVEFALSGAVELEEVRREAGEGVAGEVVARGYGVPVALKTKVGGAWVEWQEQRVVVRAESLARRQEEQLEAKIELACERLRRLWERKQGKKVLSVAEQEAAARGIVAECGVTGLVGWEVVEQEEVVQVRGYGGNAGRAEVRRRREMRVEVSPAAVREAQERLGWRVYGTNQGKWSVSQVVWCYRAQYLVERGFGRLKGKSLGLAPHYLHSGERVRGLLHLLVLGLRVLSVMEYQARKSLAAAAPGEEKITGLYAGQPQKSTKRPTSELMLAALKGVSLVYYEEGGEVKGCLTRLKPLQERVLEVLQVPLALYTELAPESYKLVFI